ncbi:GNAT family N-acetyltransferase [Fictibacillus sp. KIGAM418]|uniref:GNAT family N-acetyltransferase n=1 Tax=Fictibacillus marinisediminis TaxID=2878389 RepID=A0A9X1XF56_9BACL|nr:GNAT family N-acetyltransferase [Fictibacillus marinisediminis]MCK6258991.1 GNAT family N-acetyltransferase [Fictibacillus marinisediminis]
MSFKLTSSLLKNNYDITVVSSIEDISESELLPLTKERSFYVSRPWLLAIERLRGGDTGYVVTRDHAGQLMGVLPIYWGKPSARGYYEPFKRFLERSGGDFQADDWSPAFIVGSRAAYSCEFLIRPTIHSEEKDDVLASMLDIANKYAQEFGAASTSALYINKSGRTQLESVIENHSDFFLAGANSILDIKWNDFDEYMQSIKWKRGVLREQQVFTSKGYYIESCKLADSMNTFAELFANHERKYGYKTSPDQEAKELQTLVDTANEYSHVFVLKLGGSAVGCILLFLWGNTIYARTVGFDFDVIGGGYEYFNLAYYEVIRFAIENGYDHVEYGMGTYRAKLKRGARLEPLWGIVNSSTKPTPFKDFNFVNWDRTRQEAVTASDIKRLERIQLP